MPNTPNSPYIMYGIKNCDTIKKARRYLEDNGVNYQFHDYRVDGISDELLSIFMEHIDWEVLVNKRGTTWRKLPDVVKKNLSEASAIKIMSENSSIIKRPIIESQGKWLLGFDMEEIQALAQY